MPTKKYIKNTIAVAGCILIASYCVYGIIQSKRASDEAAKAVYATVTQAEIDAKRNTIPKPITIYHEILGHPTCKTTPKEFLEIIHDHGQAERMRIKLLGLTDEYQLIVIQDSLVTYYISNRYAADLIASSILLEALSVEPVKPSGKFLFIIGKLDDGGNIIKSGFDGAFDEYMQSQSIPEKK